MSSCKVKSLNSRRLRLSACLSLLLIGSALLGGCGSIPKEFVAVPIKLVDIPVNVQACLNKHVKTPKGDWTVEQVSQIVASYQRREDQLEDCVSDIVAFYKSYQRKLAKKG